MSRSKVAANSKNAHTGFGSFYDWFSSRVVPGLPLGFTTGVYYKGLAYWLYNKGFTVRVILANQVNNNLSRIHC